MRGVKSRSTRLKISTVICIDATTFADSQLTRWELESVNGRRAREEEIASEFFRPEGTTIHEARPTVGSCQ